MEIDRFDALTRQLATGASRRQLLRGLGGAIAGALLSGLGVQSAGAAKGGCKAAGKHCTKGGECCSGLVCGPDQTCQPRVLRSGVGSTCNYDADCDEGLTCCGDTCVDTTSDVNNCGGCGKRCSDPNGDPVCFLGNTGQGVCGADCYAGNRVCITENGAIICCAKCCGRIGYQYCCPA